MSFSRLAAIGAALVAGVTLASCASSGAPIAASGPNSQVNSIPAATLFFVQGSPQLHLGISTVDLYIDGKFIGTYPFACASPSAVGCFDDEVPLYVSLPPGPHDFKLTQPGTLNPVFLEQIFALTAGTKYALVAAGDASASNTRFDLFTVPHYNTNAAGSAASFFNASSRAGTVDFLYSICDDGGPVCAQPAPVEPVGELDVDTSETGLGGEGSQELGVQVPPTNEVCVGVFPGNETPPALAAWPENNGSDPILAMTNNVNAALCEGKFVNGENIDFFLVDSGPLGGPPPNSEIIGIRELNG